MYLPKSQYKEPVYTRGEEFNLPNGKSYIGWCFEIYTGEVYTGKFPSQTNTLLIKKDEGSTRVNVVRFIPEKVDESTIDRTKSTFKRYYIQDTRNSRIIEVSKETYYKFTRKTYIKGVEVNWNIKGPVNNVFKGKYLYEGAEKKNKTLIQNLNNLLPGLKDYVSDYKEFVR